MITIDPSSDDMNTAAVVLARATHLYLLLTASPAAEASTTALVKASPPPFEAVGEGRRAGPSRRRRDRPTPRRSDPSARRVGCAAPPGRSPSPTSRPGGRLRGRGGGQ